MFDPPSVTSQKSSPRDVVAGVFTPFHPTFSQVTTPFFSLILPSSPSSLHDRTNAVHPIVYGLLFTYCGSVPFQHSIPILFFLRGISLFLSFFAKIFSPPFPLGPG